VRVSELAELCKVSQPRMSWHLRTLRHAQVVATRREGARSSAASIARPSIAICGALSRFSERAPMQGAPDQAAPPRRHPRLSVRESYEQQGPGRHHRVGNCASSLVQGVEYYKHAEPGDQVPGLMHVDLGGYHISDIEFSAAIDIDVEKVGKDLSEAVFSGQNNTVKFSDVPNKGVKVVRGMTHDGLGKYLKEVITKAPGSTADIVSVLKESGTDVVVNYLPVGSEEATKWYTEQILAAGCAMVNCMPVFIAREDYWQDRFRKAGVPVIGDDIKSQLGATIVHRVLTRLFQDRGVRIENTYQLNFGGNTDFLNMLERERLVSKRSARPTASAPSSIRSWRTATSTSGRPTTCAGWTTASGATSGWRDAPSATSRSTWS